MHLRHRHLHSSTLALAAIFLSIPGPACCQTSADLSVVSEYAGRGVALTAHPVAQLRVEHDTAAGWYGGVFASPVTLAGRAQGQFTAYGGLAQRLNPTVSWDAGVTRNTFTRDAGTGYHEWYAGVALQRASARLFYSPAYYGEGRSLYLDLSAAQPLNDSLRVAFHAGLLHPFGDYGGGTARDGGDVRVALVADVGDCTVQAGWQARWRTYLPEYPRPRAFTASISRHF
jgi:uncharacterized protein (TIGR02001 family)